MTRFSLGIILAVGLIVRLAALFIQMEFMTLPQGGADAIAFEWRAWNLSQQGRGLVTGYLGSGDHFIGYLGSLVYDLTGRAPYVLGLITVLLGTAIIYVVHQAALEVWGDHRRARIVAWAAALFPQLVLHSALFLRETPVSFCVAVASLCAVRFIQRNEIAYAGWFALWVALGALFHSGVIFGLPALLLGTMLARPRGNRGMVKHHAVNAAAALMLVGAIYVVNETGYGLGKFGGSLDTAVEQFEQQELRGTSGGAAFPEWMRVRGGASDAWKIPIRYAAFLFSPLVPFMVRSPRHLLGVVDAGLYLFLFWSLYRNWVTVRQNRAAVVLLVVMLVLFLVYALGVANFGTAIRHRAKMSPILLLLAAGLPQLRRVRLRRRVPVEVQLEASRL